MKVIICVHKEEAISGKITNWYNICPQGTHWPNFVQVEITQDEFAQLNDKPEKIKTLNRNENDFLVSQYNRNRDAKDHITDIKQIK